MKCFEMVKGSLIVSEETWGYIPFKKLLDRDKSKEKVTALKEMLYIYNFCDIKSDYQFVTNEKDRTVEIAKDIGLPKDWKPDKLVIEACEFYNKFITVTEKLYRSTLKSISDIANYLENTDKLLAERDVRGKPVYDISKISAASGRVPQLMKNLRDAYTEVVKEHQSTVGKMKGARTMGMYEEGLTIKEKK